MTLLKFIVVPAQVYGISMEPAVYSGQEIIYRVQGEINKNDVIIFRYNSYQLINQVLAGSGDSVEINHGVLTIVDDETLKQIIILLGTNEDVKRTTIPEGRLWVMGDNTEFSNDSRKIGSIPATNVIGVVLGTWWPLPTAGLVPEPSYDIIEVTDYKVLPTEEKIALAKARLLVRPLPQLSQN